PRLLRHADRGSARVHQPLRASLRDHRPPRRQAYSRKAGDRGNGSLAGQGVLSSADARWKTYPLKKQSPPRVAEPVDSTTPRGARVFNTHKAMRDDFLLLGHADPLGPARIEAEV